MSAAAGEVGLPLQTAYCASKHAVKGFTNALRSELRALGAPVSVTLVKPSAVDSPGRDHARNRGGVQPPSGTGVYATPLVAQAILYAAEHRVRALTVGGGGALLGLAAFVSPFLTDPFLALGARWTAKSAERAEGKRADNLHHAGQDLRERSFQSGVRESSLYATAQMRPKVSLGMAVLAVCGVGLAFQLGARRGSVVACDGE